jgi:hypothetical protein
MGESRAPEQLGTMFVEGETIEIGIHQHGHG